MAKRRLPFELTSVGVVALPSNWNKTKQQFIQLHILDNYYAFLKLDTQ